MRDAGVLLGKRVTAIAVSDDEQYLKITGHYTVNEYVFCTDSECCSETWFADIIGVKNLIGKDVIGVEILDLPEPNDNRTRQEYDSVYGFRLKTTHGDCDFIYRNSSNGYYGGGAFLCPIPPKDIKWKEITDDWSA